MDQMIENLENSPLFHMSLGNKELFHSNFWKWLIERDSRFARIFFDELRDGKIEVERESGTKRSRRDLTLTCGDDVYIIENKLKSIADREQLARYRADIESNAAKHFKKGVLTGVSEDICLDEGWEFVSYKTISRRIGEILNTENLTSMTDFERQLTAKYAEFISNLSDLIDKAGKRDNNLFFFKGETYRSLRKIKLQDVWQKKRANEFKAYIQNRLDVTAPEGFELLPPNAGFTHDQALVEIFLVNKTGAGNIEKIGVQIQGEKYCRCVQGSSGNENDFERLFEEYKRLDWFQEYKRGSMEIFGRPTKQTVPYCIYKPCFVYQYWSLTEDNSSFDKLTAQINLDLQSAAELVKMV